MSQFVAMSKTENRCLGLNLGQARAQRMRQTLAIVKGIQKEFLLSAENKV